MDPATMIGIGLAVVIVIVANLLEGGDPTSMLLLPPMMLVIGGTLCIAFAGGTVSDGKLAMRGLKRAFTSKLPTSADLVPSIVSLADTARHKGLLALEESLHDIEDEFLVQGVTLAIDGVDPDEVREILESEILAKRADDKQAVKFWGDAGAYAPTIGIVGTVMGLVMVLEQLAEPEKLGHLIAAAFVATLWGVMSANLFFLPISARLKRLSELEVARMELTIEGVSALQSGANPRVVAQKLRSLLPADQRVTEAA